MDRSRTYPEPLHCRAFVYGEALPSNHALLWPSRPDTTDVQIEEAVNKANQTLPDYASVKSWTRLDEPFSPANGLSTANGCRAARPFLNATKHFSLPTT